MHDRRMAEKSPEPTIFVSEGYSYVKLSAETQITGSLVLKLTSSGTVPLISEQEFPLYSS